MAYQVSADLSQRLENFVVDARGHRTLAEKAFDTLHDAIMNGLLAPGERLPIEDVGAALGMSPMPIREALRQLGAVGLVENIPHRGSRVAELSVKDLVEVYDARLALEVTAIHGAAANFREEDAQAAAQALDRYESAVRRRDAIDALRAHTEFHFQLYRAAHSKWLMRLISPVWESAERYRIATVGSKKDYLKSRAGEHERLLDACRNRQPERAETELWNHLVITANAVSREMGGSDLYELRALTATARPAAVSSG